MAYELYQKMWRESHPYYWKEYYKEHKTDYKRRYKKYIDTHEGKFIYFHLNDNGESIYIGSTLQIAMRQSSHLTGNSNLKMNIDEYITKYNFTKIMYKDFSDYDLNGADLRYIEKYFKERYEEIIKSKVPLDLNKLSMSEDELIEIAENEEFIYFDINRYMEE